MSEELPSGIAPESTAYQAVVRTIGREQAGRSPFDLQTVEKPGNAPGTHACKARAQPSAHPLGHRASESNAVLRTWKPVAHHGLLGSFVPRTGNAPVSSRLDKPPSTLADPRGILGDVRVSIPSEMRSQRTGFASSLTSQSAAVESNDVLSLFRRALNDHTSSRPVTRSGIEPDSLA